MSAAGLKVPVKRPGTPGLPSSQSKSTISLEEWEEKTLLSESELRSVSIVQRACEEKPLPLKAFQDDIQVSRPSSPAQKTRSNMPVSSRPGTPSLAEKQQSQPSHPMHPKIPIQTTQQFYDWFSAIERSVAHSQEAHFRDHLSGISLHLGTCDGLLQGIDDVQHEVEDMLEGWRSVEAGGRSLKDACEELLDERDRLLQLTEDINARLEYFQELEHATRMLNHPGESLVLQADFLDMVERVDICIDFLRTHRHYQEAEIYLLRFQQCLTRAMTLIKMYFVGSLKALAADISKRLADKEISQTAQMHLLYTRFQSVATQVAPLLRELERRTWAHPDELTSLLSECHSAYFSSRRSLLVGRLAEEIRGLDPSGSDLIELTRSGCSYLRQLCIDEYSIYRCFFDSGRDQLYQYLEGLCDYLYDDLRPRILHETRLTVLCGVCNVLQALMVLDIPETEPSSDEEDDFEKPSRLSDAEGEATKRLGRLHIKHMLQGVLQDAQTRLFFKAQNVVQAEIRYYVPKPEDLDYPKNLEEARRTPNPLDIRENDDTNELFRLSSYEKRATWYPTVKTTLSVLGQLHDFVQPSIFDDIAQESIDFCRISLASAATLIATASSSTEMDSSLFLIRHLLILKELVNNLNLASREQDGPLELRYVAETLRDILRTTRFIPSGFASSLKARDDSSVSGTKEGIDDDLRKACELVINICAGTVTRSLQTFMLSLNNPHDPKVKNARRQQPPQTRDAAIVTDEDFKTTLESELPKAVSRLRLYLADSATVSVLLTHIQDKVITEYISFRKATELMPAENDRTFVLSPESLRTYFIALS